MTSKEFKVIIYDENNQIYKAQSIESDNENFNKDITDNFDSFLKKFSKDYTIKNITNEVKSNSNRLLRKSKYFGYYNPFVSAMYPNTVPPNPSTPSTGAGVVPVDSETGLSNLIGAVGRLESTESYVSPFPDKISDEEWTNFVVSEFITDTEVQKDTGADDLVEDETSQIEEGLSSKVNPVTHISILDKKFKKEIKEIKNSIENLKNNNLDETNKKMIKEFTMLYSELTEMNNKEINAIKSDIHLIFEKIAKFI